MRSISPSRRRVGTGPISFAGTPAHSVPGANFLPWVTTDPAATIHPSPTTQSSMTIAPMPMSTLSSMVQPCTMAL